MHKKPAQWRLLSRLPAAILLPRALHHGVRDPDSGRWWIYAVVAAGLGVFRVAAVGRQGLPFAVFVISLFTAVSAGLRESRAIFGISLALSAITVFASREPDGALRTWWPPGRIRMIDLPIVLLVAAASAAGAVLVAHWQGGTPGLPQWAEPLPSYLLALGGVLFAVGNAALEETVFRGIFLHGLEVDCSRLLSAIGQAAAFAAIHWRGVPGGTSGMVGAGVFGFVMGWLRYRTGGLLVPVFVHFLVDVAIVGWTIAAAP